MARRRSFSCAQEATARRKRKEEIETDTFLKKLETNARIYNAQMAAATQDYVEQLNQIVPITNNYNRTYNFSSGDNVIIRDTNEARQKSGKSQPPLPGRIISVKTLSLEKHPHAKEKAVILGKTVDVPRAFIEVEVVETTGNVRHIRFWTGQVNEHYSIEPLNTIIVETQTEKDYIYEDMLHVVKLTSAAQEEHPQYPKIGIFEGIPPIGTTETRIAQLRDINDPNGQRYPIELTKENIEDIQTFNVYQAEKEHKNQINAKSEMFMGEEILVGSELEFTQAFRNRQRKNGHKELSDTQYVIVTKFKYGAEGNNAPYVEVAEFDEYYYLHPRGTFGLNEDNFTLPQRELDQRIEELIQEMLNDSAALNKTGGIDFNPNAMDLHIENSDMPAFAPQPTINMNIEGFTPIIINITPITSAPMLLGLSNSTESNPESLSTHTVSLLQ